ncbi:MAG: hypothetical protein DVS81_00515 [Candidatus Accumulibacter meliphilus]|jgi:hypothetical protein|uniref:Uncharacterized protein n=1 Tax=Candidatus Accumulibacter meliphilus TaxID=2211374 RepID=A0A369XU48_9PROT|nr:MAG: hypothetical protein DVS81_00515 [Candidatus Accumulibacter meliphilus]
MPDGLQALLLLAQLQRGSGHQRGERTMDPVAGEALFATDETGTHQVQRQGIAGLVLVMKDFAC